MTDQITIKNMELFAHHGVFPEEQKLGQKFLLDAVLYVDLRPAGMTDELSRSVDYGQVAQFAFRFLTEHTYQLLEAAVEQLAEAMLLQFPDLKKVRLELKKPWAPIGLSLETVSVKVERQWHRIYLGIGSNLGDRMGYVNYGVEQLKQDQHIQRVRLSKLIETAPYGVTEQPPFVNGAIELDTLYTPRELLKVLHIIEAGADRQRTLRWGPRTLDLDILFYDDEIISEPDLIIPHVDMRHRMFVLEPLCDLNPGKVHPVYRRTLADMKEDLINKK